MKKSEIIGRISQYATAVTKNRDYKAQMSLGRCIPSSAAQVKSWIQCGCQLDSLGAPDVEIIEDILSVIGRVGEYSLTKSGRWARLTNIDDLLQALKTKYDVKSGIHTVTEAVNAKNEKIRKQQLAIVRNAFLNGKTDSIDITVWDDTFKCSYLNRLTESDIRQALSLPSDAVVTLSKMRVTIVP